jgi:hypothetical protein
VTTLSLRRLWTIYKRILAEAGFGKRDVVFAQTAFYSGARTTLQVLAHLLEEGEDDEVRRTIERQGRQIRKLQARLPRARRH